MKNDTLFSSTNRIFVKGYWFLSFAENTGRNIGKHISKSLNSKYSQKLLDHTKRSATDALKTYSKGFIQKTVEGTDDLIGNKIADKIISLKNFTKKEFRNKWRNT